MERRLNYKMTKARAVFLVFAVLFLLAVSFVCFVPIWHVVMSSISNPTELNVSKGLVLYPLKNVDPNAYSMILQYKSLWSSYANTLLFIVLSCITTGVFTVIAGYVFSRRRFFYRNTFMLIISFTMLFNGGMIPTYMVVRNLGLYNSRWAVIIPSAISVFNLIILRTAFQEVPASLEESAKLDGANEFTIMFRIIVPLAKASIAVVVLYYAVGIWNSWFPAMIYLKDRDKFPLQLILRETLLVNDSSMIASSADAQNATNLDRKLVKYCTIVVGTLPIMCFYPFIQKYFTKGVMIGAVKG